MSHIEVAQELYAARRARDAAFGAEREGFGEPGWDMLLRLFAEDGGSLTESDVLAASCDDVSRARHYLEWLVSRELVIRDASDAGMLYRLAERARLLMQAYLDRESLTG